MKAKKSGGKLGRFVRTVKVKTRRKVRKVLYSDERRARVKLKKLLEKEQSEEAQAATLLKLMKKVKWHSQEFKACIDKLGELKSREAVPELIKLLNTDLRRDSMWALGEIGDPRAVPGLFTTIEIILSTPIFRNDPEDRADAGMALETAKKIIRGMGRSNEKLKEKFVIAAQNLKGLPEQKRMLLLYAIITDKTIQKKIPSNSKKYERSKFEYLKNLRHDAEDYSLKEMMEILGIEWVKWRH